MGALPGFHVDVQAPSPPFVETVASLDERGAIDLGENGRDLLGRWVKAKFRRP